MSNKSALAKVAAVSALDAAFTHIYSKASGKSKNTSGVDNQSLIDFRANKDQFLTELSKQLIGKTFVFSKLFPHFIKKANGKDRVICVPTVRDRIVQRALLDYLSRKYVIQINNPISYGFLKDKGVEEAVEKSCSIRKRKQWVFKTDITAFFDRISRDKLKTRLRKLVKEPSLLPLLESAIDSEVLISSQITAARIANLGIKAGIGIRQGMPISPFLSNVMLNRFDLAIVNSGYEAVRYADDLIFFASSKIECEKIYIFCSEKLLIEGFTIPDLEAGNKSVIYAAGETAEFLGLSLVYKPDSSYKLEISNDQSTHIRTELFKLTDLENLNRLGIDFFKFGQALNSRIGGYVSAYSVCSNRKDFENKMEQARLTIYSTVLSKLGIIPKKLPDAAKRFFKLID